VERFGVALAAVREVVDSPQVQPLPDAASSLLGVATVRGELIPLYDARAVLDLETARVAPGAALVFVADGRRVALAIDDVFDPVLVEEHELRPMPGTGAADGIILGLIRRGGDLVALLDDTALLDTMLAAAGATGNDAI